MSPIFKSTAFHHTLAGALIAVFSAAYLALGWHYFTTFKTGHDLAGYTQAVHHLTAGQLPYNSFKNQVMWGDHAHFIITLITPLFSFFPDARTLLAVQALAAATAGWAVYRVASDRLKHPLLSLTLLYAYLSFIGLQYALSFDFHPSVLTSAALAWLLYAYHFKKWPLYWVVLVVGLTTREDAPVILAMIGLWQMLTGRLRQGSVTAVISAGYFLITAYLLMPLWTPDGAALLYLDVDKKDPASIMLEIIKHPQTILQNITNTEVKRHTLNTLPQSFAYLPLLSPFTYITSAPIIYSRFNSPHDYRWLLTNHSNANIHALLTFGALFALTHLRQLKTPLGRILPAQPMYLLMSLSPIAAASAVLIAAHVTAWSDPNIPLRHLWRDLGSPSAEITRAADSFHRLKELIPPDASVTATSGFTAHLARRQTIKYFSDDPLTTEWLIISPLSNTWPLARDHVREASLRLQLEPNIELVAFENNVFLFRRLDP